MVPEFTTEALRVLRDPSYFSWNAITLLGLAIYVYGVEIEKRNWSTVCAGLAFWSMDWINEVINGIVLHCTGTAALWTTTGRSSLQILIGLNLEICLLFSFAGLAFAKTLPKNAALRIFGIPNRILAVLGFSIFSVIIELYLHATGSFHWYYSFWDEKTPWLIIPFGYGTFYAAAAWAHDLPTLRAKLKFTGTLVGTAAALLIIFGPVLGWL